MWHGPSVLGNLEVQGERMPRDIHQEVEDLYQCLFAELDRFACGQQFYSVRELQRRHAVSRRAVERVLERLVAEKQVHIEPGHGIFVASRQKQNRVVTSVHCDWPAEYWQTLDACIERTLATVPNYHFSRAFFEPNSGLRYLDCLENIHGDAILFTFPIHRFSAGEIARILQLKTPVILLEDNLLCDGINVIDNHPEYSGMLAADCLIRNGHRRLAMILSEPWSVGDSRRCNGFLDYAALAGVEVEVIDCHVQSGESSCAGAHDALLAFLKKNGPRFTGCYTLSDYSALGIISAIRDYGLRVPDDISVIGHGGIPGGAHYDPPLTTILKDADAIAATVVQGLHELFAGGTFGIRSVMPRLVERKSVCHVRLK